MLELISCHYFSIANQVPVSIIHSIHTVSITGNWRALTQVVLGYNTQPPCPHFYRCVNWCALTRYVNCYTPPTHQN
jgi:hypothetical protein